ncbi:PQQ-dependent sugar dehydrogenase [Candidatus Curtissbacteria bacterium]|nr:PQQ-dependent sugar dehydrogenase [Candidatus Curtissbacteria bacterium]
MRKLASVVLILIIAVFFLVYKTPKQEAQINSAPQSPLDSSNREPQIVAQNLQVPWAIAFLPNSNLLVTERIGKVDEIDKSGNVKTIFSPSDIVATGEGGLMGITLHPDFKKNNYIYLMYTHTGPKEKIVRYKYANQTLTEDKIILDNITASGFHHGGRIKFGPDGYLYATTGDAQQTQFAQDKNSLNGKILRMTDGGEAAPGNPFNNLVYSYGHRNPEGLTWDKEGTLWETEHGNTATDEINIIKPGQNYGWPNVIGDQQQEGITSPVITSGTSITWAPTDLIAQNGKIYFAGLRGQAIFSFDAKNTSQINESIKYKYGRLRELTIGPDGYIYLTTSNQDGRGKPNSGDDKIIKIAPSSL